MRLKLLFTIFIILLGGVLIYQKTPPEKFGDFYSGLLESKKDNQEIKVEEGVTKDLVEQESPSLPKPPETKSVESKQEVSTPGPLRAPSPVSPEPALPPPASGLTRAGIILQTNIERGQNGLGFLAEASTLDVMAASKANDMCEEQYFAHTSPAGIGAGELADSFGYDYISVGENLAFGSFAGDAAVVTAWMDSPGHRANILNSKFTEIGVGVTRCLFEGRSVWLAVQYFGRPASLCPQPDAALLKSINDKKATLTDTKNRILVLKTEIDATDPADSSYSAKVNAYNSMVREYNSLIAETKALISQYNSQVVAFNACASS